MKIRYISICVFLICFFISDMLTAQTYYWVGFKDKNGTSFSIDNPEEFLSARAILRRQKQNIGIEETDLPVSSVYVDAITDLGATLIHSSKWLNGITVKTENANFTEELDKLDFVKEYQVTKDQTLTKSARVSKFRDEDDNPIIDSSYYQASVSQVSQINGHYLHQAGYTGEGMYIAVLDGGFKNANQSSAMQALWQENRILGTKDFVDNDEDFFSMHYHGANVLSIMAANLPGQLIGTAPNATYLLVRTEDTSSEYLVEEDNWVAGAEYADSLGIDVINSSLGYYLFDNSDMNHSYEDMDGHTTRVTKAANMAVEKGMLVFASAGNEGNDPWHHIISPSDGDKVIGVGAVNAEGVKAGFSSFGPASDGDIKPNVSALGWGTALQNSSGNIVTGSGTSYSSPVMAGMGACLWQAFPEFTSLEIKSAIEESAHQYSMPDSLLGFGIPDFKLASELLQSRRVILGKAEDREWQLAPNPFKERLVLQNLDFNLEGEVQIEMHNSLGLAYLSKTFSGKKTIILDELNHIPPGLVIITIKAQDMSYSYKYIKSN